ncbi:hypothetical protein KOR34_13000 [Posidoniimonas corsicana]|uniref:Endonuclease/exonuclease/phosphatase domain-containing protein n=1 Tax=Posidoniimonas corsicana TaxID=1938618 RepID=A0A5C5VFB5_9BACT|nr:endonuclease/exonuclease/phosphatase family protein [Posidoniimonas corsicana]TWT36395.1 hypothetical protein KOR34_13000 [Posidoniimonas corsicana]
MADAPPPPPKPDRDGPGLLALTTRRLVCLASFAAAAASLYAGFDALHWTARLVTPFRPQLLAAGVGLLLLSLIVRGGWSSLTASTAAIAINLSYLWPWLLPVTGPPPTESFQLISWNTWTGHETPTEVSKLVAESGVDVALLCELPRSLIGPTPPRIEGYDTDSHDQYAIAVRRGGPVELISTRFARPPYALEARVRYGEREIRLLVLHATRPTTREGCRIQDVQMMGLRSWFDTSPLPTVIVGDFNQTPWCPRLSEVIAGLGLTDTSRGRGLTYTYPAGVPLLSRLVGVPIDQCLITPDLACGSRWVGNAHGSNHRPVYAEVGFRSD